MQVSATVWRSVTLTAALGLAVASMGAQARVPAQNRILLVRTALAHGDLSEARRIASGATGEAADRAVAQALIDMFQGDDAAARQQLEPVAARGPLGDAALELGLLEIRTGQVAQGRQRLASLAAVRTFASPDDYFRLARAAGGVREFLLANDAFQQIADVSRADIQTAWGDVFLERHQAGDAATSYRKALEIDAKWVPAMVGLARALADDAPDQARAITERAQAQAPDHPAVIELRVEQSITEDDDPAGGRQALDHLARVKPGTVEEAGWRAALAYKDGGLAAADAAAARVEAIDPVSALGYRLASEQAAREYRFDDAAALARKGVAVDADDPAVQFDLGLSLLRTGDEAAARTALDTSWELDKSSPVTKNLLDLLDHLATFDVVAHNDFIFKFAKNESAVLQPYALPLADEAYRQFSERYGFRPRGPILVEVFPTHDDFAVRTLGLPGLVGALGACFGRVVSMDSPDAPGVDPFSWQATLWHELAHVFTLQLSDYRVPRWLTEGISVYEEHRRQPAWGRELTLEFARRLAAHETFGVKKLPDAFKHPETLSLAYFEASLVVEHLVDVHGDAGLRALLEAYAGGATDAQAFETAFGESADQVEASFATFVNERYGKLAEAMKAPAQKVDAADIVGLRARAQQEPGNFISQLSLGQALVRAGDLENARAPLERAAALAPMATGDGSPHALLARIAESQNDPDRAIREWRALLENDHTNVPAARRLAALAEKAHDDADEDVALRLIADVDPFDAGTHSQLGHRLLGKGDAASALVEFQAALALGPTNLAEVHTDLAEAHMKLGQRAETRREALLALQEAPTFARAQDLLLWAEGR